MYNVILQLNDKKELTFITEFLKKLKIKNKVYTIEEIEDIGLLEAMKKVDRTQKVSREKVMSKLGRK